MKVIAADKFVDKAEVKVDFYNGQFNGVNNVVLEGRTENNREKIMTSRQKNKKKGRFLGEPTCQQLHCLFSVNQGGFSFLCRFSFSDVLGTLGEAQGECL